MSRSFILLVTCLFISFVPQSSSARDWPTYRGDAQRSGYTSESIPNRLELRWVFRMPHPPNPAWPSLGRMTFDNGSQVIVVDKSVVFGSSSDDTVYALEATTGAIRWKFVTGGPVRFAPAAWRDRVFVASDDGWLYALALNDGQLLWRHRGGPDDRMVIGNGRLISHWPMRGGPVVMDDTVYCAAGIWPSDGVFIHALDADTGARKWLNDQSGGLEMPQPHGGAVAKSGISAQGYLMADSERLFVPTGRAVPAAFQRNDGKFLYYHLQANQQHGGSFAIIADQFFYNGGYLFHAATGELALPLGLGPLVALPERVVRAERSSLGEYRWIDFERPDRKGVLTKKRELEKVRSVNCEREVLELIIAGNDVICGEDGAVCAIDYTKQRNRWWSHAVEGKAIGLAAANGQLIVSTDRGVIYAFDDEPQVSAAVPDVARPPTSTLQTSQDSTAAAAATKILEETAITQGYCVDLGCADGSLALELARRTEMHICGIESDPRLVAEARARLAKAGLYGERVTIHQGNPTAPFYPAKFANLVVSSRSLKEPVTPDLERAIQRLQRPYGGMTCTGPIDGMRVTTGGMLPGAGNWTHQNANAANTICSSDQLVAGPLEMLWFHDIQFQLPNRHAQGPAPLYQQGRLIVGGLDGLCALDAFNGNVLWRLSIPDNLRDFNGIHHDVGVGEVGSNFCLGGDSVFVKCGHRCLRVDIATGKVIAEYETPIDNQTEHRAWGYLAYSDGMLFGSVSDQDHRVSARYKSIQLFNESVLLFAIDINKGDTDKDNVSKGSLRWTFRPKHSIRNNAIAIGAGGVYLIDRPIALADRISSPRRDGKHRPILTPGEHAGGELICLDATTGDIQWQQSEDIFGTQLALSSEHGIVLMNYQAVRHSFFRLPSEIGGRMAAFESATGNRLWNNQAKYQTRPIVNGVTIYAQGGAWDLKTGKPVPFEFHRSYGCGQIAASTNMMVFRSGTLGYLDLSRDVGTENFGGVRTGCWFNAIPAGGMVLVPEGSTRCECSYQMKAWFALRQRLN